LSTLHQDDGPIATGQKVMLATTAYDSPDDSYTFAIAQSREALAEVGIQSAYVLLSGNCHVDDARNSVVYTFMESDCTDLIFLDADVSWRKEDLVMLCQYDLDLVGGVYPYRREDGRAKRGMPYIPMDGAEVKDGLVEVIGLPTGFMRIRRNVFDTLIPLNPKFDNNQKSMKDIPLLFERTLKEGTRMGGDLNFCLKWVEAGGSLYASTECLLGHVAKTVIKDSLGAFIRRHNDQTLQNFVEKLQAGTETDADFREAFDYVNNPWGAENGFLTVAAHAARTANKSGPILESGSGLTTIVMAACAPDQMVYCLEHNEHFANITRIMARACGLTNIAIVHTEIKDRWYDITDPLPDHWALGLNDGPPRQLGDRMKFLYFLGDSCDMIISDDADDPEYAASLTSWADNKDRQIAFPEPRSAIIMKEAA
tara:strand:- start:8797 stop:10071 length:1275 start_codon:yes stop_codon:yes gene_type:complete